ncbi:MAG TPA: ATP-binding protein [Bacteroidales bacterium]|nr:ATP-binding protein [Bacteroidales bacterium]
MELVSRFFKDPDMSYFLFGPRGTGKSTWLKSTHGNALYIDLLNPETFRTLSARPERLLEIIEGNPEKNTVILDEVQKLPYLLDFIHKIIEDNKRIKFILTGSSSRKLKRSGVDLLAGRAANKTFHPFMAAELGKAFHLEKALQFGLIPLICKSKNPRETLNAYLSLYLNEEIRMEGFVRNIGDFSRFLEAFSFSNGSILNTSEIARECEVGRKTVEGYISVLEDLLLIHFLPVFSRKAKRNLIVHPKVYFFDTGIFRVIRPSGPLDKPQEIDGVALETLVMQHLAAWCALSGKNNKLYYWRTKSGNEVDFVLYGNEGIVAIEVKNTQKPNSKDFTGLRAFKEDYPAAKCLMLYRGKEKLKIHDIFCYPCEDFLKRVAPDKPLF